MGAARAPRAQPNPPLLSLEAGGAPNFAKLWKGKGGGEVESPAVGVEDEGFSNQSLPCTPPPRSHTPRPPAGVVVPLGAQDLLVEFTKL